MTDLCAVCGTDHSHCTVCGDDLPVNLHPLFVFIEPDEAGLARLLENIAKDLDTGRPPTMDALKQDLVVMADFLCKDCFRGMFKALPFWDRVRDHFEYRYQARIAIAFNGQQYVTPERLDPRRNRR